ncbi:MAG: hypothetical protein QXZ55_00775 [Pyrobaculum sp.]
MSSAIAEKRGLQHYSRRDYAVLVGRFYEETGVKTPLLALEWRRDSTPVFTATTRKEKN